MYPVGFLILRHLLPCVSTYAKSKSETKTKWNKGESEYDNPQYPTKKKRNTQSAFKLSYLNVKENI